MNVLVSINRGYLRHFKVMLHSLIKVTSERLRVFVMHDDLTDEDVSEIRNLFKEVEFQFVFMDGKLFCGFPAVKRYPYTIYFRIFAPFFLPDEVERVLYLDCDLVVHKSLSDFYNTEFNGNYFVACTNTGWFLRLFNRIRLSGKKGGVYMNTGVVLMNISALRKCMDKAEICKYTVKNKWKLMLYDQDVLYHFYGDKILVAPSLVYNLSDRQLSARNFLKKDKMGAEWVEKNNAIIHYIGKNKPWKKGYKGILGKYYLDAERDFDAERRGIKK